MQIFPVFLPHAGCPHRCLFCDQHQTAGARICPEPDQVRWWLDQVLPASGTGEIAFYGGTFSALPPQVQTVFLQIGRQFLAAGRIAGIRVSTRPDALSPEQADRLAAGGVSTVEIGCQSFDEAVLAASRRGHSEKDIGLAVAACRAAGLNHGLQLMPGLPGGRRQEALASLRAALALRPAFLRIYPTVVCRGTGLAALWERGEYEPLALDEAVDIVAEQLLLCRKAGVPVIRTGLQDSAELQKSVLAGPYHPAFGQLVKSRLWRLAMARAAGRGQTVSVHPHDLADALGHGRENVAWLRGATGFAGIKSDGQISRGRFEVDGRDHSVSLPDARRLT